MMQSLFYSAQSFTAFLERVETNAELWRDMHRLARVPSEAAARFAPLPGRWHLLAIVEDWCGDAVNTLPLIARVAELTPNLDLRVMLRDEHPAVMDAHLTCDARSIPVVIVLDENFVERAWWGPRPRPLQELAMGEWAVLPKDERYRLTRTWYARDRGRTTIDEIVSLIREAAAPSADLGAVGGGITPPVGHDWNSALCRPPLRGIYGATTTGVFS